MSDSLPDPILTLLIYLAIGVAVWITFDPTAYVDGLVRAYARRGTSPTAAVVALMVLATIVAWPDAIAALLDGRRP